MKKSLLAGAVLAAFTLTSAAHAETAVSLGFSGWTGFAPLTLAKEAGIFKKNGLDVTDQNPAGKPPSGPRFR